MNDELETKVAELTAALKASRQLVEDAAMRSLVTLNRAQAAEAKAKRYELTIRSYASRPDSRCASAPDGSCVTMHQLCAAVGIKPTADATDTP